MGCSAVCLPATPFSVEAAVPSSGGILHLPPPLDLDTVPSASLAFQPTCRMHFATPRVSPSIPRSPLAHITHVTTLKIRPHPPRV